MMLNQSGGDHNISFQQPQLMSGQPERRSSPRRNVNMRLKYQLPRQQLTGDGELHNLSETGMLITIKHWAAEGDAIHLVVEPKKSSERPLLVEAVIVRTSSPAPGGNFTYGCQIQNAWNHELLP